MNGIKVGLIGCEVDVLMCDYIMEKGYGEYFGYFIGYGIGFEIYEVLGLVFCFDIVFELGMVVIVELGIYILGIGGVCIEDDIIVISEGNEVIMKLLKEFIIL